MADVPTRAIAVGRS